MIYKDYGKTGKKISVIGYGGMRFHKENEKYDIEKCASLAIKANELGVNYFDTAPGYCDDMSETIMGEAFKHMPNEFYTSTKSSKRDGSELRSQLENSLKVLGLEKITFFHIWCIMTLEDYKSRMVKGGAYEAALKAKEEGLIEHIVFSTHCNGKEIEEIVKQGYFEGITLGYNIINSSYRNLGLKVAYEQGLGVATMNPLGGGIIPQKAEFFDFIREKDDKDVVSAALRFNASHKEITTVLAGMGTMEEVLQNISIGDNLHPYSEDKLKAIETRLTGSVNTLCTGCSYCKGCPQDIQIPKFMQAYNNKILTSKEDAISNLKYHWSVDKSEAGKCIKCGLCESECTQHISIMERLEEINNW